MIHENHEIEFTRRRYGKQTFTWIYVKIGANWQSTGDPLPKLMPSRSDLTNAIKSAYRHRNHDAPAGVR